MNIEAFYQHLLNPPVPWRVSKVELTDDASRVDVWLDHPLKFNFKCPDCGVSCPVHDHTAERVWRHLDTCESSTWLHARLPRVKCVSHGVRQAAAPLSDGRPGLTLAMETRTITILAECNRDGASRVTGLSWDEVDGVMERAVARGLERRSDAPPPKRMGIDEKAVFKRHKYCTILTDLDKGHVIEVLNNRGKEDLEPWFNSNWEMLRLVEDVAMDMSAGYHALVSRLMPDASVSFDHFHVTRVVLEALDRVRKDEQRTLDGGESRSKFFRSRFLPLYNAENIPEHHRERFEEFKKVAVKTSRAWAIKENLRGLWGCQSMEEAKLFFDKWFWWATHSRLEPMVKAAKTLKRHWGGIANAITRKLSNACAEGINSKIERIKRDAFGFRSRSKLRTAILFHCGGLDMTPRMALA